MMRFSTSIFAVLMLFTASVYGAFPGSFPSNVGIFEGPATFELAAGAAGTASIFHDTDDGLLQVCGGNDATSGFCIEAYGASHATLANDLELNKGDGTRVLGWDDSADAWELGDSAGNAYLIMHAGVGNTSNIWKEEPTGAMSISGGNGATNGGNAFFAGGSHATLAGDFLFRDGSTNIVAYDASANSITFSQDAQVNTPKDVALVGDDQAVTIGDARVVGLTSDDGTAVNRTFTLSGGVEGQRVLLYWESTNEGQLVDTGTTLLTANWEPTDIGESIELYHDGTNWTEINRVDIVP